MANTPRDLYALILDSIDQGVFTVDSEYRITFFNAEAESITGFSRQQALGRKCYEVLRANICQTGCAIRKSLETGKPQHNVRVTILNPDMESVPISVSSAVLRGRKGEMIGGLETFRDITEIETLRRELTQRVKFRDIIGKSKAMQDIFRLISDVAPTHVSVLIQGASGTGKELLARAIHDISGRHKAPFVRVNCGALPDTLLESELFGYVRGAFTDARKSKPGRFQQADKGTLFLDEVGELSPAFQVKLLRVLQEGEVQPLGSTKTQYVNVRVISATNRNLQQLVRDGQFREDLYYRLCVMPIHVPPLQNRREDIVPLLEHYMHRLRVKTCKDIHTISQAALTALLDYDFPGNVRELENILERAFVLCHSNKIGIEHLPPEVTSHRSDQYTPEHLLQTTQSVIDHENAADGPMTGTTFSSKMSAPRLRHLKPSEHKLLLHSTDETDHLPESSIHYSIQPNPQSEIKHLIAILNANGWNRGLTAAALGISRSTLWRRMQDYGLLNRRGD